MFTHYKNKRVGSLQFWGLGFYEGRAEGGKKSFYLGKELDQTLFSEFWGQNPSSCLHTFRTRNQKEGNMNVVK